MGTSRLAILRATGVVALFCAAPAVAQDLRWVPATGGAVPANAIIGGQEPGRTLPICRGAYNNGVHPGKVVAGKCNIGWGGREIELRQFEVLTGNAASIRWQAAPGGALPPGTFAGGQEPGRLLYVCRAAYRSGIHPGKVVAGRCNIGWGGKEIVLGGYEVMVAGAPVPMRDVSAHVENLGIPLQGKYPSGDRVYARNVWDLQVFGNRVYIGSGNSNNEAPAKNAGPVDVYAFDPATNGFVREAELKDEQIDVFRIVEGALVIPGHDPEDSIKNGEFPWFKGNFYRRRAAGGWDTFRTIPLGVHNYDMISFGGSLYAALGTPTSAHVVRSTDGGRNWSKISSVGGPWSRERAFFVAGGVLHVSALYVSAKGTVESIIGKVIKSVKPDIVGKVYAINGGSVHEVKTNFFPGDGRKDLFVAKPVSFMSYAVYLGAEPLIDHDWTPAGLYAARSSSSVARLTLPGGITARDLLVRGDTLYALGSTGRGAWVFATRDLQSWRVVLSFNVPTFARSFELLNGDWYFGLGSDPSALKSDTGRFLRVKAAVIPKG